MAHSVTPPRGSPGTPATQPGYFQANFGSPGNESPDSKSKKRIQFQDDAGSGLGIHMAPISVKSPGSIYQMSPQFSPPDSYSPLPSYTRQPTYLRTPDSAASFASVASRRTDPMTERLIQHRATQAAQWRVHWRTPTMMVVSFLTGILLAISQHILYSRLHHKSEPDEDKKIRVVLYGRALAYLSKVAFGNCVILCYRQRIWRTFRERALSVFSIDQLFLATEDPSLFLNWETVSKATLVTLMALLIWLIPVATIVFSPAALTFGDIHESQNLTLSVPNLNFSAEVDKDWRHPIKIDGANRKSLMFVNTTDKTATQPGWFDYYDQPSADLKRISLMVAYSLKDQSLNREDARITSCGGDFNCTYTIEFTGPGYKCKELAHGPEDDQKLAEAGSPFNTSALSPRGKYVYLADVKTGDYTRPQISSEGVSPDGGIPQGIPSKYFGYFTSEPTLWIGYSINSTKRLPPDSPFATNWTHRYDPYIFACTHYETRYTVRMNYSGPFFTTNVTYLFEKPIVDTNFSRMDNGIPNTFDPRPESNFISPSDDPQRYKLVSAYHAMGERLRSFLDGHIELEPPQPGPSYAKVHSEVTSTRLVSNASDTPLKELPTLLQDFYADMILSLFSAPQMLVVSEERVTVARTKWHSTFIYNPGKMWACYAPVVFLSFLALIVGALTIHGDGTTFSVGFSRIMVTTRNTTLDEISRGACLGNDPFPAELMHTRLKFGVLNEGGHEHEYQGLEEYQGAAHCAFGVPSELTPITVGVPYAGLQQSRGEGASRLRKQKMD